MFRKLDAVAVLTARLLPAPRYHEQQIEQMWCLTLVTNAVVCWMAEYLGLAVAALRGGGYW
ncbi:MAG TPA: hypothetical protein VK162_01940 [Streptosporangiaceae bacterium]|nr:hypothetical protein [Streptosporangiaceae bacterium]